MVDYFLALIVLGLGTARLTALVSKDGITEPLRDKLYHAFPPENSREHSYQNLRRTTKQERKNAKKQGFKWWDRQYQETHDVHRKHTFLGRLVECPFCVSVWIGVVNFALYYNWPHEVMLFNSAMTVCYLGAVGVVRGGWLGK